MQKREMVLVAVPADLLHEAGICEGSPLQMYADGERLGRYRQLCLRR